MLKHSFHKSDYDVHHPPNGIEVSKKKMIKVIRGHLARARDSDVLNMNI